MKKSNRVRLPLFENYNCNEELYSLWNDGSNGGLNCNATDGQTEIISKLLSYMGNPDEYSNKLTAAIHDSSLAEKLLKKVGTRAQDLGSDVRKGVMRAIISTSSDQDKLFIAAFMVTQYTDSFGAAFVDYLTVADYSSDQRLSNMIRLNVERVKQKGKAYFVDTRYVHKCGFNKWFNDGDPKLEDIKEALERVNAARIDFNSVSNMDEVLDFLYSYIALNNGSDSLSDSVLNFFKDQVKKYDKAPRVA